MHWPLLSSYRSPTWHLLPTQGCFVYSETLLFRVATFLNYLSSISQITCCSLYISTCEFTLHFCIVVMASFPKPHEPTSASFTALSLPRIKERWGLALGFWLEGMFWLVWFSIQTTTVFSILAMRLFCFLIISVFTRAQRLVSFVFTPWLTGARGLAFSVDQISTCLPHSALSFLTFDLKWEMCGRSFHVSI